MSWVESIVGGLAGRAREPVAWAVDALGTSIDRAVEEHHRRRLQRHGHGHVLDAGLGRRTGQWWVQGVPLRQGNHVELLVDGDEIVTAVTCLVRDARRSVHVTGWHSSPDFWMDVDQTLALRDLLAEVAERVPVRLLLWAGAPVPVFEPGRAHVRRDRDEFVRDSRVECLLDARERPMHCHHEKLVIVDDETAIVGGLDLTHLDGSRLDDSLHDKHADLGWHDVALLVRGPVVGDIARHFAARWAATGGEDLVVVQPAEQAGGLAVQMTRTVPNDVYDFLPDGEYSTLASYLVALRQAQHLVYLENQFLWSPEVVDVLIEKLMHPPTPDFRLLLVLPRHPNNGEDTTVGQLARLIAADAGRGHLLATTLLGPTADSPGVYVHAKVGIIDDRWVSIGSTNLNEHSLFNDTEVNVLVQDEDFARATRLRLWSEHLRLPVEEIAGPTTRVIDEVWTAQCDVQDPISEAGGDPVHRVRRLLGLSRRSSRLKGPLLGLVVDG